MKSSANLHLLKQLTLRAVQERFKGSVLGWGWMVGQPLLMMAVYTTVFGVIFGGSYDGQPEDSPAVYAVGIFLSLGLFQFFSEILQSAPQIVLGNTMYVKKVAFPLELLPLSSVGTSVVTLLIQIVLVVLGAVITGNFHLNGIVWLCFSATIILVLGLGVAFWFSALGVFIRYLQQISSVLSLVLLYASGVFYSVATVVETQPEIWAWLRLNPIIHLLDAARSALLFGVSPAPAGLVYAAVFASSLLVSGYSFFRWIKSSFADVL